MFQKGKTLLALASIFMTASVLADQASFVANANDAPGQQNPVAFDSVHINRGDALHQDTWKVHIQSPGLFLVTLSAGHPGASGHTNYSLQRDGSMVTSLYCGAKTGAMDDTMGLDIVSFFFQHEELHIRSVGSSLKGSPLGKLTSWGMVSLSHEMGVAVAFGVGRTTPNAPGKVTFDRIWANTGNVWDITNNTFIAPVSGVYFFSFSVGLPLDFHTYIRLYVNGQQRLYTFRGRVSPYVYESLGRSVMMHLMVNDQVYLYSSHPGYSNLGCLTTFSGFLYNALRNEDMAWAVYRSSSHYGSADPLVFDHVEVNVGGVWANNRATCFLTGLYYVHISTGVRLNYPVQMTVMKGSLPQGEIRRLGTVANNDVASRSMMIHCNAGETLRVVVSSSSGLFSLADGKFIAFIGFYLFP